MKSQLFLHLLLFLHLDVGGAPPVGTPLAGPVLASLVQVQDRQQDLPATFLALEVVGHHIVTNRDRDRISTRHLKLIKICTDSQVCQRCGFIDHELVLGQDSTSD